MARHVILSSPYNATTDAAAVDAFAWERGDWTALWAQEGMRVRGLADDYPALVPLASAGERAFFGGAWGAFTRQIYGLGLLTAFLYLVLITAGTRYMAKRPAWNLRGLLILWNLALAVFSVVGAMRTVPHLLYLLATYGFTFTSCGPAGFTYGSSVSGVWTTLFIYSKYIEMVDTLFLILRKKPLRFLHWYHHLTVFLYCWDAFANEMPTGIFFIAMNYTVHAVMYTYYFLAAVLERPLSWGIVVTIMQVSQMFIGVGVTAASLRLVSLYSFTRVFPIATLPSDIPHVGCSAWPLNAVFALIMYATYLLLFLRFFVNRYIVTPKGKGGKGGKREREEEKDPCQTATEAANATISGLKKTV